MYHPLMLSLDMAQRHFKIRPLFAHKHCLRSVRYLNQPSPSLDVRIPILLVLYKKMYLC